MRNVGARAPRLPENTTPPRSTAPQRSARSGAERSSSARRDTGSTVHAPSWVLKFLVQTIIVGRRRAGVPRTRRLRPLAAPELRVGSREFVRHVADPRVDPE